MDPEMRAVLGAAMEVHAQLGPGYVEPVYQEALALEFKLRGILFEREVHVPVFYKGKLLSCFYRADFICSDELVVELKAVSGFCAKDAAQVMNYLRATDRHRGLLINFGVQRLQFRRVQVEERKQTA